jgi:glycerol kinase
VAGAVTALLVVDVGTTGLRAAIVDDRLDIVDLEYRANPPISPFPGLVEFDPDVMAGLVLDAVGAVTARCEEPIVAVGVTSQRASTIMWHRRTGRGFAPALGWQDLRTVGDCIVRNAELGGEGSMAGFAPNQMATKAAWLLEHALPTDPPTDRGDVVIGTVDSWVVWVLSGGAVHVSDATCSSATMTGLRLPDGSDWDRRRCASLGIPVESLPDVVPSVGVAAVAQRVEGAPPIAAIIGDQQASLVGQGCTLPGDAKITFGTGGILDLCTGTEPPATSRRGDHGTYPLPLWRVGAETTWGVEAIMLAAGSNVEWLQHDLGILDAAESSHDVAAQCESSDGVVFVPALLGLGTPRWDYGARGTLVGLTRGSGRPQVVRAVLEGVAHRGVDLVEAATADTHVAVDRIRIDGGMSRNLTFVQALADLLARPVDVARHADSTTVGAAFLAGLGVGVWDDVTSVRDLSRPLHSVEPRPAADDRWRRDARARWHDAVERSAGWIPDLSAIDF